MRGDELADRPSDLRGTFRTLLLVGLGSTLENYDVFTFALFIRVIGRLFFPDDIPEWVAQLQSFGIFAAGNLARPLGGIVLAHLGDKLGRKTTFMISILIMAVATLGIAVTPTYASIGSAAPALLLALRVLQGSAFGAELPGAWTFIAEHVPERRVGLACGLITAGLALGTLLATLTVLLVNTLFTPGQIEAFAWRLPFLLGSILALGGVYVRRWLAETPVFQGLQRRGELAKGLPLAIVLRHHRRGVLISMGLAWLLTGIVAVLIVMTPTLLQTLYGIDARTALRAASLASTCSVAGYILAGLLADRLGAGLFFVLGTPLLAAIITLFYALLPAHPAWLLPLYALAGLFAGVGTGVPFTLVGMFPAPVRFSGVSFTYNIAAAFLSGLAPPLVALGLQFDKLAPAYALLVPCLITFLIGIHLLSLRTKQGVSEIAPAEPATYTGINNM